MGVCNELDRQIASFLSHQRPVSALREWARTNASLIDQQCGDRTKDLLEKVIAATNPTVEDTASEQLMAYLQARMALDQ
jgi:hypothetical protein